MPKKTVLEMSAFERLHYSLGGKTFRAIVAVTLIVGLAALGFGFYLYYSSIDREYRVKTWHMSRAEAEVIDRYEVLREAMIVTRIYDRLSEEERQTQDTDEYKALFNDVSLHVDFAKMRAHLYHIMEANEARAVYTAILDTENNRMIFLADADLNADSYCAPGTWDSLSREQTDAFINGAKPRLLDSLYGVDVMTSMATTIEEYGYRCTAGTKLFDYGNYAAYIFCDTDMNEVADISKNFFIQFVAVLFVVMAALIVIFVTSIRKTIVNPINDLAHAAHDYMQDRNEGNMESIHFSRLTIRTGDEIENLSLAMKVMETDIAQYVKNLTKATAERERVSTELDIATRIQEGMLPSVFPPFPDRKEFDIFALMDPAKEVGGDFYNFFFIDDDHLGLVIADVSGKGVPGAMFMMASMILITNFSNMDGTSPAKILEKVNHSICQNNKAEMFVTVWLAIVEISTGRVKAANAGHEYPAIQRAGGAFELFKDKHGFVVGGMDGMKYKEYELELAPGDCIFVYTDGVPEATSADTELFGTYRMLEALNKDPEALPEKLIAEVREAIDGFVKDAPQFDDITMLGFRYFGPKTED